jgi:hypothetical protein
VVVMVVVVWWSIMVVLKLLCHLVPAPFLLLSVAPAAN